MDLDKMHIGKRVIASTEIITLGVMPGTEGVIIEHGDYIGVAWDTPGRPIPKDMPLDELARMPFNHPDVPFIIRYAKSEAPNFLLDINAGNETA